MDKLPVFHVKSVDVPDHKVWPTDLSQIVTRYALVDDDGVWWINGHRFGVWQSEMTADRTSSDCRCYLRESSYDALKDCEKWYHFEMGDDGRYKQVEDGR